MPSSPEPSRTEKSSLSAGWGTLAACLLASSASASVTPASLFQDHAVLQAGKPVAIWGEATPGEKISVSFQEQTVSTTTSASGTWKVILSPLKVNANPAELIIAGTNTVILKDVLVGEVWLCSGQSNMGFALNKAKDAAREIDAANFPLLRQFHVQFTIANEPQPSGGGTWAPATPETAGNFTAVGYFFAREMHQKLGVPIGIIRSTWGGTDIESWMSGASIDHAPELKFVADHWQQRLDDYPERKVKFEADLAAWQLKADEAKAKGENVPGQPGEPPKPGDKLHIDKASSLYNGMIAPLRFYTMRGVLWYQGENNAGRADEYRKLFPALIQGWRAAFEDPALPFFWVQLPNFQGNPELPDWAELRDAQSAALKLPETAQAVAIDLGENDDVHPPDKREVGRRLALLALQKTYQQNVVCSGPRFASAAFAGGSVSISFTDLGGGLTVHGPRLTEFELAGSDGAFKPAEAQIEGDKVVVRSAEVPEPAAVRYAWRNAPEATLFNKANLPAAPFRSDFR